MDFRQFSQPFHGFDSIDVHVSEQCLLDRSDTESPNEPETFDTPQIKSHGLNESKDTQTSVIEDQTDHVDIDLEAENRPIDEEIMNGMALRSTLKFEFHSSSIDVIFRCLLDEQYEMCDAAENLTDDDEKISVLTKCAALPKDDPETQLFLSYS